MKRNLNETALFLRPLFGIPKMLFVVVSDYLKDQVEQIDLILKQHQRDKEGIERFRTAYKNSGGRLQDALYIAYGVDLGQDIPVAQLAPVLQLTYIPVIQKPLEKAPETVSKVEVSLPPAETVDRGSGNVYGVNSGMPAPVVPQEPLFYKKGRRYVAVNGTPVQGEKFKRVMKGKTVRYVPT